MNTLFLFVEHNPVLISVVLGAILVYKLLTSNDWISKLFGVGIIIVAFRMFVLVATLVFLFSLPPTPAYACDSIICLGDWFGWTDVAKIHSDRDKQLADIESKKAADLARINADAEARIAEANREIEQERVQGQISAAQAQAMSDAFAATVNAKRDEYVASITQNAQVAIAGLNNAANVSIAGINQTGETERSRLAWDGKGNLLAIAIIGTVVLGALGIVGRILILKTQHAQAPSQITVMLANPYQQQRSLNAPHRVCLPQQQPYLIEEDNEENNL